MARDYSPAGQMVVHGTEESLQVGIIKKIEKNTGGHYQKNPENYDFPFSLFSNLILYMSTQVAITRLF